MALQPASADNGGVALSCNAPAVARAVGISPSRSGGPAYLPALLVWVHPRWIVPSGITASDIPKAEALCGAAAENQLTPAFILGGLGVVLVALGPFAVRYFVVGDDIESVPESVWASETTGRRWRRWWDAPRWTGSTVESGGAASPRRLPP